MRRYGRPLVAIVAAYALLLAPLLGATARAFGDDFALCLSRDNGAPSSLPDRRECCVLGACHAGVPALTPAAAVLSPLPARRHAAVHAPATSLCLAESSLAAPPRGPPSRA
jgi:hypothetical protein